MIANQLIDEFREVENQKLLINPIDKARMVKVHRTSELAQAIDHSVKIPKQLLPWKKEKRLAIGFLLVDVIGFAIVAYQVFQSNLPLYLGIFLFMLFLLLLVIPISFFLRLQKSMDILSISSQGISTVSQYFNWAELDETLILQIPEEKKIICYLVLVTAENLFLKFDLSPFSASVDELSMIIENYKAR